MTQLFSSPIGLSQLDPPHKERIALNLTTNTGGSAGDDGQISFATGAETYTFDSNSIRGPQKPKAITSAWIDATNLAAGKTLTVQCSNGQKFILQNTTAVAGQGPQGYFIIPLPAPFKLTVTTNNGAALNVVIILYNYNVAFTGFQTGAYLPASAVGSSAGAGGSGGSGGGSGGFFGGGGFLGCPIKGTDLAIVGDGEFENQEFENENWIDVTIEGTRLIATSSHLVYSVERGKITLHELEVGEHVLTVFGESEVLSKLYYKEKGTKAVKVHVSKSHLYYAEGILSHNKA